jgi:hypothetical protein
MNSPLQKLLFKQIQIRSYKIELAYIVWFSLALIALVSEMARGLESIDNFLIFRGVFYHVWQQKNLFIYYPSEYVSFNNYGPAFSLIIAPFAVLPVYLGCFLWGAANATSLFVAIRMLPIKKEFQIIIYWISCLEMMTSMHSMQFNPMFTAFFIFAFVFTHRGKDWLATFFIAATILSKVYGIAGLALFFFSKNKARFVLSFIAWMAVFFALPMVFSSPEYILNTYVEWYYQIIKRNQQNIETSMIAGLQDISVPGMIRRIFNYYNFSDLKLIAIAGIFALVPLFRNRKFYSLTFQLQYLALILISIVIFSSAAESPTFVIAVTGVALWFILQKKPAVLWQKITLILLFLLTMLSPTDLFPVYIRENFIKAYSLKALPCFIVWCIIIYQLLIKDFTNSGSSGKAIGTDLAPFS